MCMHHVHIFFTFSFLHTHSKHSITHFVLFLTFNRLIDHYRFANYKNRSKNSYSSTHQGLLNNLQSVPVASGSSSSLNFNQHDLNLSQGHTLNRLNQVPSSNLSHPHLINESSELIACKRPRLYIDNKSSMHQPLMIDTLDMSEVKKVGLLFFFYFILSTLSICNFFVFRSLPSHFKYQSVSVFLYFLISLFFLLIIYDSAFVSFLIKRDQLKKAT